MSEANIAKVSIAQMLDTLATLPNIWQPCLDCQEFHYGHLGLEGVLA